MTIWLDAQLSPVLANWIRATFNETCFPIRDLGELNMADETLFLRAKKEADLLITKDVDLVHLLHRHGPPPKVVWLRMGNTSNARLKQVFTQRWSDIMALTGANEPLVELVD
ncbi:MAG: DUF5615 family PIN-like protein [Flavobacteriales bacterium]|nr:MAG: DUF5615 family PIN-like protein [Flavobacteriales bacterium]